MTYTRIFNEFVSYSYLEPVVDSTWKRFLKFLGLLPEFVFTSPTDSPVEEHITAVAKTYCIREHICPRESIYGVISYTKEGVTGFRIYGVYNGRSYLNPVEIVRYCVQRGLPVPYYSNDC